MKIKKGDTVLIISGKDRNKKGKIVKSFPTEGKVIIDGVNLIKKHQRAKKAGEKGQIVQIPSKINVSNVEIICPSCKKITRISSKVIDGKKSRACKKCGKKL